LGSGKKKDFKPAAEASNSIGPNFSLNTGEKECPTSSQRRRKREWTLMRKHRGIPKPERV